jgi:hypothetical protein
LFHDVCASKISDRVKGPEVIRGLLNRIKDKNLSKLLEKMVEFNFESRWSI